MRETKTELYIHIVWATWDRLPLLSPDIRTIAYACIQAECRSLKVEVLVIGGTEDHVHLLVKIPATIAVSVLVKQVKGASSHLVNNELPDESTLKWQGGYGAFSVSRYQLKKLRAYILEQEKHHAEGSTVHDQEPED